MVFSGTAVKWSWFLHPPVTQLGSRSSIGMARSHRHLHHRPTNGTVAAIWFAALFAGVSSAVFSRVATPPTTSDIQCRGCADDANQTQHNQLMKQDVANHCLKVCECPLESPQCPEGVSIIMDGCGCCPICARQQGDTCNRVQLCDARKKLHCVYAFDNALYGVCKVKQGRSCFVGGDYHKDGETFMVDCRTQCTCQNGTYGCVSLCPNENIRPSARCRNPQLVSIRNACCREWLCEPQSWENREPNCSRYSTEWTPCSATCGVGWSYRVSNDNAECEIRNEARICQLRPCEAVTGSSLLFPFFSQHHHHHLRRNHLCRATVKTSVPVRLTDGGNCTSVRLYQPRYCGYCPGRICCSPQMTTTLQVSFYCNNANDPNLTPDLVTKNVMWIVKCTCPDDC